ncbi:unnamed protein product [Absidia cylindrospora]
MARIRPCENCKRRRRKCERASGDTTCVRCTDSTTINYDLAEINGDDELEDLCQYVKTLEEEMKQLQLNLDQQRQRN